jgi:hypothetical protein|uniref:Uncharacterized protein n=1 Tax=Populus trichocarpa TaxID=3694 RepID=A0A2K2B4F0_POPTR
MHLHYINKQLYNHKITKDSQLCRSYIMTLICKRMIIGFMYSNKHCGSGMVHCSTTFDLTFLWKREER